MAILSKTNLLDPPWPEQGGGKSKRGADKHYRLIKKKEDILRTIMQSGCWNPDPDSHIYLWVTNNYLQWGLWLLSALGFTYKTNVSWIKYKNNKIQIGLGQYFRGSHELMLFGSRGKACKPEKALPSAFFAPRTKHSQKPEKSYEIIEATSPGPYTEFFARKCRVGWNTWGNEI